MVGIANRVWNKTPATCGLRPAGIHGFNNKVTYL